MNFASHRRIWFVLGVLLLCLVVQSAATACPNCKEGMEGVEHSNVKQGYFWSILFMMSMPFFIFFGLGIYFYLKVRKARAQAAAPVSATAEKAPEPPPPSSSSEVFADEEELVEV